MFYTLYQTKNMPYMKKTIVGAFVGAIIIFFVQFLSWTVLNLHYKSQEYTPKQDSILAYLNSTGLKSGQYLMPGLPQNASSVDQQKRMEEAKGKPWAVVAYHRTQNVNMVMSMIRVFVVNLVVV